MSNVKFSDAELATIRNFVGALNNKGVQSVLKLRVGKVYGDGGIPAEELTEAIKDLQRTCDYNAYGFVGTPENVWLAAPSLALVAQYVVAPPRVNGQMEPDFDWLEFPEDFKLAAPFVRKCLEVFFADVRATAAGEDEEIVAIGEASKSPRNIEAPFTIPEKDWPTA